MTATITLAWVIALAVLLSVRSLLPVDVRWWVWTCVTGVVMGLFGLWYVPFLKRRRARIAAERAAPAEPEAPGAAPAEPEEPEEPEAPGVPPAEPEAPGTQLSSGYVSRDNGSNTVSSTDTPGKSTRS